MDWFFTIVRVAGASFPVASSLVQLSSEIDSKSLKERVCKLEDPISNIHNDVPALSRQIYKELKDANSAKLYFDEAFYKQYSRALAALESHGYIKCGHALGKSFAAGISLADPSYIMYLCAIDKDEEKMDFLVNAVDSCEIGQWLDGSKMNIDLPTPVIKAVFDIYESKGYGVCSKEVGTCKYMGKS